jgi:hypothetical protein
VFHSVQIWMGYASFDELREIFVGVERRGEGILRAITEPSFAKGLKRLPLPHASFHFFPRFRRK